MREAANISTQLFRALDDLAARHSTSDLRQATTELITAYRSGEAPAGLVVSNPVRAAAYAAYRMPATYAAVSRALSLTMAVAGPWEPTSLLDLGGGTGAATWASAAALPTITRATVMDASAPALELGQRLARSGPDLLQQTQWERTILGGPTPLPRADLVIVSYLLGELADSAAVAVLDAAAAAGSLVLVVEPGTPRGYAAVLGARDRLIERGWSVVAPCPHGQVCPLTSPDWCHFSARLSRSALHRDLKAGDLGFEDEKFSFVALRREPGGSTAPWSRVLRHPLYRKGLVQLELCRPGASAGRSVVTKRAGAAYRSARDLTWGDTWDGS